MDWALLFANPWVRLSLILIGVLFVTKVITLILTLLLKKITSLTETTKDDELVEKMENPLVYLVGLLFLRWGIGIVGLIEDKLAIVEKIIETGIIVFIAYIIVIIADIVLEVWGQDFAKKTKNKIDEQLIRLFHRSIEIVVGAIAFLYILNNVDIEIWPLLGSLGIAGLAIAFAFQETLKNLFGGISLILDKNIKTGDIIQLPSGETGTVYDMTLRSTRVKTFDNRLLIIPNSTMANEVITNISRPDRSRRVEVKFAVAYGADPEYVKHIIMEEIKSIDIVEKNDPLPRVIFQEMADNSLNFSALYWVKDLSNFIAAKEEGTIKIYERLNKENISIPFPQRTVWNYDMGKYKEQQYTKKKIPKETKIKKKESKK
jgi:MscS family membrane protein